MEKLKLIILPRGFCIVLPFKILYHFATMKINEYYKNSLDRSFTINTPAKNSVITEFLYSAEETN